MTTTHQPKRWRWVLAAAMVLAVAAVLVLTRTAPVVTRSVALPALQGAQAACQAGTLAADGSLVLDAAPDPDEPSVACVVHRLEIPEARYAMLRTALHDAVPEFGNATNTIAWGRFYAKTSPSQGRVRVQIVALYGS